MTKSRVKFQLTTSWFTALEGPHQEQYDPIWTKLNAMLNDSNVKKNNPRWKKTVDRSNLQHTMDRRSRKGRRCSFVGLLVRKRETERSFIISVFKEGGSMKEKPWRPWRSSRERAFIQEWGERGGEIWDMGFVQLRRRRGGLCSEIKLKAVMVYEFDE